MKFGKSALCVSIGLVTFASGFAGSHILPSITTWLGDISVTKTHEAKQAEREFLPQNGVEHSMISRSWTDQRRSAEFHLHRNFDGDFAGFESVRIPHQEFVGAEFPVQPYAVIEGSKVLFEAVLIDNDVIVFQTEAVRGVRYYFTGSFRKQSPCGIDVEKAGIEGHLVKVIYGKMVAATKASFYFVYGC